MSILLTDDEIMDTVLDEGLGVVADENTRAIAKAQLKKLVGYIQQYVYHKGDDCVCIKMTPYAYQSLLDEA